MASEGGTVKKLGRVAINTIEGKYLRGVDKEEINKKIQLDDKEEILFVWSQRDKFEELLDLKEDIIVTVTTKKMFKIEKGAIHSVNRENIKSVKHQKNGMFSWDKIELITKDKNEMITFGIYHGEACKYFCNYLSTHPI